jgi:apolipoprotein N-acyltransferase
MIAFGLGGIASAGQAPFGVWGLTLLALAGLFYMISAQSTRLRAALVGWLGGAGYFCTSLSWILSPFFVDVPRDAWMAPFALVIMGFGLALFWGLAAGIGRRSLGLVVTLTAAELARGYVLTGFPWALIGHIWIDTPIAQLAALIGPSGLTLLTCALAMGVLGGTRLRLGAALTLALAWGFGAWQLAKPMPAKRQVNNIDFENR